LREESRLKVYENRVLRRIFGPKRYKVTREWRKLHKDQLTQYCSDDQIEEMGWAGYVARMGEWRGLYRVLMGKTEGKRPLGRPRYRWG
jgi:hypothetical protein